MIGKTNNNLSLFSGIILIEFITYGFRLLVVVLSKELSRVYPQKKHAFYSAYNHPLQLRLFTPATVVLYPSYSSSLPQLQQFFTPATVVEHFYCCKKKSVYSFVNA